MRILLVDDDRAILEALSYSFMELNYVVDAVSSGDDGWAYGTTYDYDLIILDWMLPDRSGVELCHQLRDNNCLAPILLITAKDNTSNKVVGLDAGADDYITKPFDLEELQARIRALLRRSSTLAEPILNFEKLSLDPRLCEVKYDREQLILTAKEYSLLELFLRSPKQTFSIGNIIDRLWPTGSYPADATVRSHVRGLRRKLKLVGAPADLIETVNGMGYRLQSASPSLEPQTKSIIASGVCSNQQQRHRAALAKLWKKHESCQLSNIDTLINIIENISTESPSQHLWQQAKSISHTLTGTLGSYGFNEGSAIASQIDRLLDRLQRNTQQYREELSILSRKLRQTIELSTKHDDSSTSIAESKYLLIVGGAEKQIGTLIEESHSQNIRSQWLASLKDPKSYQQYFRELSDTSGSDVLTVDSRIIILTDRNRPINNEEISQLLSWLNTSSSPIVRKTRVYLVCNEPYPKFKDQANVSLVLYQDFHTYPQLIKCVFQPDSFPPNGISILAIDDDPSFLEVLPTLLKPWHNNIKTISNPCNVDRALAELKPHILLLDLKMPKLNGLELCKMIRNNSTCPQIPILVVSAYIDAKTQMEALAYGADDVMQKPVSGYELSSRVIGLLNRYSNFAV